MGAFQEYGFGLQVDFFTPFVSKQYFDVNAYSF